MIPIPDDKLEALIAMVPEPAAKPERKAHRGTVPGQLWLMNNLKFV